MRRLRAKVDKVICLHENNCSIQNYTYMSISQHYTVYNTINGICSCSDEVRG